MRKRIFITRNLKLDALLRVLNVIQRAVDGQVASAEDVEIINGGCHAAPVGQDLSHQRICPSQPGLSTGQVAAGLLSFE